MDEVQIFTKNAVIKYSKKIRYTTYIRVFEKYHTRLHASVINLR